MVRLYRILGILAVGALLLWLVWPSSKSIRGDVLCDAQPVEGVRIRERGQPTATLTKADGSFELADASAGKLVAAAKPGFLIQAQTLHPGVRFQLERFPTEDDPHYAWIDAKQCATCHGAIFDAWTKSSHAHSATNPRFLDLIEPKDGRTTWNLKREHPDGIDVCAKCHLPTHAPKDFDFDPRKAYGVALQGVHCDLCHKVADVSGDKLGTRFGIDALDLRRPKDGKQLFFGPLDDAVREGESFGYAPVYRESRYCASCHEGTLFGTAVYKTFSEWEQSRAKVFNRTCQDCHMAPTHKIWNAAPGYGGVDRMALSDHATPGLSQDKLCACLDLQVKIERDGDACV